uniref:MATH domain and coiled-coil domain-containing protein n=1 Tax=Noccaea caerulescens TaxID=107243 RepID=A0A1J3IN86_NOCCA
MALEFRAKNQNLRTSCINVLLNLIETLCQSLQDLSIDDLGQAEKAVTYLKDSGFKVDWLEQKLKQVKEKKMEEQNSKTRMQELEEYLKFLKKKCSDIEALLVKENEELQDSKHKCSEIEALLEKEKAKVLAARAPPLTLDDLVCLMT